MSNLIRALDEDRLSDRKLFPPGVKGGNLVSQVVLLDAGPLGLVTNPKHSPQSLACAQWLQDLIGKGERV